MNVKIQVAKFELNSVSLLPWLFRRTLPKIRDALQAYNARLLHQDPSQSLGTWKTRQLAQNLLRRQIAEIRVISKFQVSGTSSKGNHSKSAYLDLLNCVEIVLSTQKPESITFDLESVGVVHSSNLKKVRCFINRRLVTIVSGDFPILAA